MPFIDIQRARYRRNAEVAHDRIVVRGGDHGCSLIAATRHVDHNVVASPIRPTPKGLLCIDLVFDEQESDHRCTAVPGQRSSNAAPPSLLGIRTTSPPIVRAALRAIVS